ATHVPLQTPPAHVRVPMWLAEQTMPHPPQLSGSFAVSTLQPFSCLVLSQFVVPAAQDPLHAPLAHVRVGMLLPEHTVPQAPRLSGSTCLSWQVELQHVVAVPPSTPHALPHIPQFKLLIDVSMHVLLQHAIGPAPASPPSPGPTPPSTKQSAIVRHPSAHV